MRLIFKMIFFSILLNFKAFGQTHNYKVLDSLDTKIINDVCALVYDTSLTISISPYILPTIDTINISILVNKYDFNNVDLFQSCNDSLMLNNCNLFKILNPDSVADYINVLNNGEDPAIYLLEKNHKQKALITFHKILFNKNKNYAIVQYWIDNYYFTGWGEIILMKMDITKWQKIESLGINVRLN